MGSQHRYAEMPSEQKDQQKEQQPGQQEQQNHTGSNGNSQGINIQCTHICVHAFMQHVIFAYVTIVQKCVYIYIHVYFPTCNTLYTFIYIYI